MTTSGRYLSIVLALGLGSFASAAEKWQFAGENQGIAFQLQITNQCKDGSKVSIKLKSALDHPVTVTFRLNDADWKKTFTYALQPKGRDANLTFVPEDSQVCHPYVDQVYVESPEPQVSQSEDTASSLP